MSRSIMTVKYTYIHIDTAEQQQKQLEEKKRQPNTIMTT